MPAYAPLTKLSLPTTTVSCVVPVSLTWPWMRRVASPSPLSTHPPSAFSTALAARAKSPLAAACSAGGSSLTGPSVPVTSTSPPMPNVSSAWMLSRLPEITELSPVTMPLAVPARTTDPSMATVVALIATLLASAVSCAAPAVAPRMPLRPMLPVAAAAREAGSAGAACSLKRPP